MAKAKTSALVDTRVVWCGDCLEQLRRLPDACVDLVKEMSNGLGP